eukprot:SAG11_NODE_1313_length_5225_cov_4.247171_5_plen_207_part_00
MLKIDKARHDAIARQWARKYADAREVTMEETQLCRARQRLAFAQLGERVDAADTLLFPCDLLIIVCTHLQRLSLLSYDLYEAEAKEADMILDKRVAEEEKILATLSRERPLRALVIANKIAWRQGASKDSRKLGAASAGDTLDVVELLRTSSGTIRAQVSDGGWVTAITRQGKQLLHAEADLDALLQIRADEPEPEPKAKLIADSL